MTSTLKKITLVLTLAMAIPALSACNTIAGMGKDAQAGGEAVEEAAEDAK